VEFENVFLDAVAHGFFIPMSITQQKI